MPHFRSQQNLNDARVIAFTIGKWGFGVGPLPHEQGLASLTEQFTTNTLSDPL